MEILQAWYNVFPKVSDEEFANPTPMRKKTRCRTVVSGPSDDICLKDMPKFVEEQIQDANIGNFFIIICLKFLNCTFFLWSYESRFFFITKALYQFDLSTILLGHKFVTSFFVWKVETYMYAYSLYLIIPFKRQIEIINIKISVNLLGRIGRQWKPIMKVYVNFLIRRYLC